MAHKSKIEKPILFSSEMARAILDGRKTQTRRVIKNGLDSADIIGAKFVEGVWRPIYQPAPADCGRIIPKPQLKSWHIKCPYTVGDLLYVRESYLIEARHGAKGHEYWLPSEVPKWGLYKNQEIKYKATDQPNCLNNVIKWRPNIHLPKRFARIWLEITNIRVERVQDITKKNVVAEGILIPTNDKNNPYLRLTGKYPPHNYWPEGTMSKGKWPPEILKMDEFIKAHFASLWDSLNAKRGYSWEINPYVWVIEFKRIK